MVVESQTCQHNKNVAQWHIVLVKTYAIFLGSRLSYLVTFWVILNQEFHSFVILPGTKKMLWSYLSLNCYHFPTSPLCLSKRCAVEKTLLNKYQALVKRKPISSKLVAGLAPCRSVPVSVTNAKSSVHVVVFTQRSGVYRLTNPDCIHSRVTQPMSATHWLVLLMVLRGYLETTIAVSLSQS